MAVRKLLEATEWQYYVYENDDTIELSVPIPKPAPGFDITHTLSQNKKEEYSRIGIAALKGRIEDMKVNFYNYQMNSWR